MFKLSFPKSLFCSMHYSKWGYYLNCLFLSLILFFKFYFEIVLDVCMMTNCYALGAAHFYYYKIVFFTSNNKVFLLVYFVWPQCSHYNVLLATCMIHLFFLPLLNIPLFCVLSIAATELIIFWLHSVCMADYTISCFFWISIARDSSFIYGSFQTSSLWWFFSIFWFLISLI